tara:strand:- start:114 stop:584 length:471 start_codon:yes stop_codon:yes gene_type:complete
MLVNISYKNWPSVIYIKYNNIKINEEIFNNYKEQINILINKINEYKSNNNDDDMYVVINIQNIKTLNLDYASKYSKFYDYIIKNIKLNIKYIYLIVKDNIMKMLIKSYINFKFPKEKKIFSIFKSKIKIQNILNKHINDMNDSTPKTTSKINVITN